MNRLTRLHVVTSLVWFAAGSVLGLLLAWEPSRTWAYGFGGRPSLTHVHFQLVGFVTQMIFGVAYHVLPTLSRGSIHSYPLGYLHFFLVNGGLLLFGAGFWWGNLDLLLPGGGLLLFAGFALFLYNIGRSFGQA